ncbi:ABC transporter ATP-binding protein [Neorhizobium sp. NCHU2750]|uniref:ABC transporter ATP-binding protein n=1 Tax=Neorhizobium sp. NCHU2750 TaxID=1825976 RepID=UPI0013C477B1
MSQSDQADIKAPLLSIRDLRIEVRSGDGWREVVHGVSLDVRRGDILGVIGESGAGKSTIGLAAMGYAREGGRIASGSVIFDGVEVTELGEKALEKIRGVRIAYVAQSAASFFNPAHTLLDQFCEVLLRRNMMSKADARAKGQRIYRELGLPDPDNIGDRYPHQLSGGQLQRAMIAMAMATDPDLIIFDEPTTALDVTTQLDVIASIRDTLAKSSAAAIYISHDLALVAQVATHIAVMRHGDLVEYAPTRELLAAPKENYTAELIREKVPAIAASTVEKGRYPVLHVEKISAGYGNVVNVLQDIDLKIDRGSTVAVVGESGSGKSTLARVICGLLPAASGHMLFNNRELEPDFRKRSRDTLRRIQLVYQMPDLALNPRLKIGEVIGRPLEFYHGLSGAKNKARVIELLETLELKPEYFDRYQSQLSGGEKQRVSIARALAAEPDLIICDEITSALDQLVAAEVLKTMARLKSEFGVSYMFITHDMNTVKAIADDVVVMRHGKVLDQGPKTAVFSPPYNAYTELLLTSTPEMDPDWLDRAMQGRRTLL